MTDPTRQAFLDAIRNAPADDLPRLVYADWLEENGEDERAELIRLGCELERIVPERDTPYPAEIVRRIDELAGRWKTIFGIPIMPANWSRGFLNALTCAADEWIRYADRILAEHPVQEVTLTTFTKYEWFMDNLPPNWPLDQSRQSSGERYVALDALEFCWPGIRFNILEPVVRAIPLPANRPDDYQNLSESMFQNILQSLHVPARMLRGESS